MADRASDQHLELAVKLSIEALKSLLLLNGGAATALIALSDKSEKSDYGIAIILFGLGAILSVLAFIFGYFSQLQYANSRWASEYSNHAEVNKRHKQHLIFQKITLVVVALSLVASASGMWSAYHATTSASRCAQFAASHTPSH